MLPALPATLQHQVAVQVVKIGGLGFGQYVNPVVESLDRGLRGRGLNQHMQGTVQYAAPELWDFEAEDR